MQYDWIYQTLLSTPEDYDVVVTGHALLGNGSASDKILAGPLGMCKILSGFKTCSQVSVENPFSYYKKLAKYYANGEHIYDFTSRKSKSKVLVIAGDVHRDIQTKADYDENGNFVLVKQAVAKDEEAKVKEIPLNFGFPQDHVRGSENAKVTLYEYSSFGCTHCADFHLEVLPEIIKEYVDTGLIKVAFVPFPLEKNSMDAALLAECVDKDKYFAFADVLFKKQRDWGLSFNPQKILLQYASLSGLAKEKAEACLRNDITAAMILQNRKDGIDKLGIEGTPSFFVVSDKKILYFLILFV